MTIYRKHTFMLNKEAQVPKSKRVWAIAELHFCWGKSYLAVGYVCVQKKLCALYQSVWVARAEKKWVQRTKRKPAPLSGQKNCCTKNFFFCKKFFLIAKVTSKVKNLRNTHWQFI